MILPKYVQWESKNRERMDFWNLRQIGCQFVGLEKFVSLYPLNISLHFWQVLQKRKMTYAHLSSVTLGANHITGNHGVYVTPEENDIISMALCKTAVTPVR